MAYYPNAEFLTSANRPDQFIADSGREVAFAGRSNAGKSSAINALVNRKQFARTSKTPGRTQLINFFRIDEDHRLVDLPGYGFAKVAGKQQQHWRELMGDYFGARESLTGLFLIVDIRRLLTDYDRMMLELVGLAPDAVHIVLTKADKLKRGPAKAALLRLQKELPAGATVQLFSATKRQGIDEARARLDQMLGQQPA